MAAQTEYINLEPSDTVASVKEQLSSIRGKRVLLVLPDGDQLLTRKLDLVLVQRETYRRAIQLALVSRNPAVLANADELNISCFATLAASKIERWKRGRQKVFLPRHHKPDSDTGPDELRSIASRLANRNRRQSRLRNYVERFAVLAILLTVIGSSFYVVLPSAVVEVTLKAYPISATVDILADVQASGVDVEKAIIPAQIVRSTVETTATIPTSGQRILDETLARGIVTFSNRNDREIRIPADTILSTSSGAPILYRTVIDVRLPAGVGRTVDLPFEAMQGFSGNIGNVASGTIDQVVGSLADSATVRNASPASGGEVRTIQVVAAVDKVSLLDIVRGQLQSLGYEEIQAGLTNNQVTIIESINIDEERKDWTHFSADVGLLADELTLTMRATVSAIVVDDRLGRQVAMARLQSMIPQNQALLAESVTYERGPITQQDASGRVKFTARSSGRLIDDLDVPKMREQLAGMSLDAAQLFLQSQPELSTTVESKIEVFPDGFSTLPLLPVRINLLVRQPT